MKIHRNDLPERVVYTSASSVSQEKARIDKIINILCVIALLFFTLLFLFSGGMLLRRLYQDKKNESMYSDLESLINVEEQEENSEVVDNSDYNEKRFEALHERNPDFMGWITIDDTAVNYPVMYAPDRFEYYLRKDFNGDYNDYGVPFIDEDCTVNESGHSNNLVIYGHHMKTGSMFGSLTNYVDEEFFKAHPYVKFDTLYDDGLYEVFGAFTIDVDNDPFLYHTYTDMDEESYRYFVNQILSRSPVQSGITPVYGEDLITLSTCEYSHENGRMVVVARRVNTDSVPVEEKTE